MGRVFTAQNRIRACAVEGRSLVREQIINVTQVISGQNGDAGVTQPQTDQLIYFAAIEKLA